MKTLANISLAQMSVEQASKEIEIAVDSYLSICRTTRNRSRILDARNAYEALIREAADGNEKRQKMFQSQVEQYIAREVN